VSSSFCCAKLQDDMDTLLSVLRPSQPHFVFCMRPNKSKKPRYDVVALWFV
jgi:myosin heavy subunit